MVLGSLVQTDSVQQLFWIPTVPVHLTQLCLTPSSPHLSLVPSTYHRQTTQSPSRALLSTCSLTKKNLDKCPFAHRLSKTGKMVLTKTTAPGGLGRGLGTSSIPPWASSYSIASLTPQPLNLIWTALKQT